MGIFECRLSWLAAYQALLQTGCGWMDSSGLSSTAAAALLEAACEEGALHCFD